MITPTILDNGAPLLAAGPEHDYGEHTMRAVAAMTATGFAVWTERRDTEGAYTFDGEYFGSLIRAAQAFERRKDEEAIKWEARQ